MGISLKALSSGISSDLSAGLTIGAVLVPQSMAYALLAGLPSGYGLAASILPILVYSFFSRSSIIAIGPVAIAALITAEGLGKIATPGSELYLTAAFVLAGMVGIIQIVSGLLKLGFLANFLSIPIVSGYTSAAAIIIAMSQFRNFIGAPQNVGDSVKPALDLNTINPYSLALGLGALGIILLAKRINKLIPGPFIAIVLGILLTSQLRLDLKDVSILNEVSLKLSNYGFDLITFDLVSALLPVAFTLSILTFMETMTISKSLAQKRENYPIEPNRTWWALALANIAAALSHAFPVSASFSRTSISDSLDVKNSRPGIISAFVVLIAVLVGTKLLYYLPVPVLAAIILASVLGLFDLKRILKLYKNDREDWYILILTFFITLVLGVQYGLLAGILLSLFIVIYHSSRPHYAVLGYIESLGVFRNTKRFPEAQELDGKLIFRFDAQLYFANAAFFSRKVEKLISTKESRIKEVIFDMSSINRIDSTGIAVLSRLISKLKKRATKVTMISVKGPIRDTFLKNGITEIVGPDSFFLNLRDWLNHNEHNPLPEDYLRHSLQSDMEGTTD